MVVVTSKVSPRFCLAFFLSFMPFCARIHLIFFSLILPKNPPHISPVLCKTLPFLVELAILFEGRQGSNSLPCKIPAAKRNPTPLLLSEFIFPPILPPPVTKHAGLRFILPIFLLSLFAFLSTRFPKIFNTLKKWPRLFKNKPAPSPYTQRFSMQRQNPHTLLTPCLKPRPTSPKLRLKSAISVMCTRNRPAHHQHQRCGDKIRRCLITTTPILVRTPLLFPPNLSFFSSYKIGFGHVGMREEVRCTEVRAVPSMSVSTLLRVCFLRPT